MAEITSLISNFLHLANVQSFLLFCMVLILYKYLFTREKRKFRLPPGPRGLPIMGNLLSLSLHFERDLYEWNKEYGPVCRLKMASIDFIVLGSVEAVDEAFVKKSEIFSDRMQNSVPGMSGDGGIVFMNNGKLLKEQRRFGLATLKDFGMGRRSIEPGILELCTELCEEIDSYCENGKAFDIDHMMYFTVSSVICKLVFNKNLVKEDEEFRKMLDVLSRGAEGEAASFNDSLVGIIMFYPGLKAIPPFRGLVRKIMEIEKSRERLMQGQIDEHKRTRDPKHPRDFIDCFLKEMDKAKEIGEDSEKSGFSDKQLLRTVRDLFLAGSETTANTLRWALLFLCLHPDKQDLLCKEIDEILGQSKQPSMAVSDQMPYTKAVIQETLRLRPLAPIGLPHVAKTHGTIMGYDIPKGAVVVANLFRIQNDENAWPDPEKFDPMRHFDDNGNFVRSPKLMPFSIGSRQCLGMLLANMELFLILISMLQRFSFHLEKGQNIDVRGKNIIALRPYPFKVFAKRR